MSVPEDPCGDEVRLGVALGLGALLPVARPHQLVELLHAAPHRRERRPRLRLTDRHPQPVHPSQQVLAVPGGGHLASPESVEVSSVEIFAF